MITRELSAFLRGSVRSVWAVELLLILRRRPGEAWSPQELVRELRGSAALVAQSLETFQASGVVRETEPGRYAYAPASRVIDGLCEALEQQYKKRPTAVIHIIATSDNSKVQGLADAFRFRGKDK